MSYLALIFAVFIGVLLAYFIKPNTKWIQLCLSFSGAYLLSITVLHLIPHVFENHESNIGLFILLGILVQTILEFFSKGAEHGHIHAHDFNHKIPWLLLLSLGLHAFLEGLPLSLENDSSLLWAIVIHKIPVTVVLVVFLLNSKLPKRWIYSFIVAFAFMSPLGSYFSTTDIVFTKYANEITAVTIGIFLHISNAILFESSQDHKFNYQKFIAIILGFCVAIISVNLLPH